ncbi:hypothetical protein F0562_003426 [Nyssa sinensis]|uniref:Uncharacterized protein n=1 Tax=Nyssa sinensis TaxID=561372 RepID=A0A5J5BZB8_9ASTE|nr:hypothetical protein F0562_003426 [Nyssa sinensis]
MDYPVCYDFAKAMVSLSEWLSRSKGHARVDAQAGQRSTFPLVDVKIVVVEEDIEEQVPLKKEHPSSSIPPDDIVVEQEAVVPRTNANLAFHLTDEAMD